MAIAHFSVSIVGRGTGRSAVLSAAYRHCARMTFEREARTVDYRAKKGLVHEEFLVPSDAPAWVKELVAGRPAAQAAEAFWNAVEAFEKRADAQLAKDLTIALPVELSVGQNTELVRDFVQQHILSKGMVADWVYHDAPNNPHIHLMMSLRPLVPDGFGSKKVVRLSSDGEPLRTRAGKIAYGLWAGDAADFNAFRDGWFERLNHHLALAGLDLKVDGRSYERRGIDLVPTPHLGVGAKAIERKAGQKGAKPALERRELMDESCAENRRRILRRPETVIDLVAAEKSVFDHRDVARVLNRYIDDPSLFQQLMASILHSPRLLQLQGEAIALATGAIAPARYTTRELIRLEAEMARRAAWLSRQSGTKVSPDALAKTFLRHARLSEEQRLAIERATGEDRIAAVVGRAGAGKTSMMLAAREAWEAAGLKVVGAALAGKAAEGLEQEAGIRTRTVASWRLLWKQGSEKLDQKTVLVLDEAGMVASDDMASIVASVVEAGAKLVLVGDPEQLQPIGAGAAFRAIVDRIGYAELQTIYRQRDSWMREASLDLARGNVAEAIDAYSAQGRVLGSDLKEQAIVKLISDWGHDYDPQKSSLILAHLRRDVRVLNELARKELLARGVVGEGHLFRSANGVRLFDVGDQVVFLRNDSALGVKNGMLGRIVEVAAGRIVVVVSERSEVRSVTVEQRSYGDIDYGYATTIHKSQGTTVDRVKVLASLSLDRHLAYVAMTRHRQDMKLYYSRRSFTLHGGLSKVLSRQNAKETTLDYERGGHYRQALRFAENRGLDIVVAARTLLSGKVDWMLRQRTALADLASRLRSAGARFGLWPSLTQDKGGQAMVSGARLFALTLEEAVEQKLGADPVLARQWQEVAARLSYVFVEAETALQTMKFSEVLADRAERARRLQSLLEDPASFGALKGRTGILASRSERHERQVARANVVPLKRGIERYVEMREAAQVRARSEELARRHRMSTDIPRLSTEALRALSLASEAMACNDLTAALDHIRADHATKAEIDAFGRAVSQRFGERVLLSNVALEPAGRLLAELGEGLGVEDRQKLLEAWAIMRTAQQLAIHERAAVIRQRAEELGLRHGKTPAVRQ